MVQQAVRFKAYDLLQATNRQIHGSDYEGLRAALKRLDGTRIETNIITGNEEITRGFRLIDSFEIVRETRDVRMQEVEVKLSDWVFNAIESKEVLTLHRDYFRLRKPLERRLYDIARKHCGQKKEWKISIELLQEKCGSRSKGFEFKRLLKNIIEKNDEHNHFPDYIPTLEADNVVFTNRKAPPKQKTVFLENFPVLRTNTFERAKLAAPRLDVYLLEEEWHGFWLDSGKPEFKSPDAAFIAFCKRRYEKEEQQHEEY